MKTKLIAAALIALSGLTAEAKDVYFFSEESATSFKTVADVSKITFTGSAIELTGAAGVTEVAFADFAAFSFTDHRLVGVGKNTAAMQGVVVSRSGNGAVAVKSHATIDAITVYSATGATVAAYAPSAINFELNIATPGIYFVKVATSDGEKVVKIANF